MGKLGESLEKIVKEKKLSYYEVSKATGISQSTLCLYTSNPKNIKIENLIKLAKFLGVSIDRLLCDSPPPELQRKDTILDFKINQIKAIVNETFDKSN